MHDELELIANALEDIHLTREDLLSDDVKSLTVAIRDRADQLLRLMRDAESMEDARRIAEKEKGNE